MKKPNKISRDIHLFSKSKYSKLLLKSSISRWILHPILCIYIYIYMYINDISLVSLVSFEEKREEKSIRSN